MFKDFILPDKCNLIIDGQFGSTGKGLIASAIAEQCHVDLAVGRLSPNAGHTFYLDGKKNVTKLLPVAWNHATKKHDLPLCWMCHRSRTSRERNQIL